MTAVIFDLGGTLMEYRGMPACWADYYAAGFRAVREAFGLQIPEEAILESAERLKAFNPRIRYREIEYSSSDIFRETTSHWSEQGEQEDYAVYFFKGLTLKCRLYRDSLLALRALRSRGIRTAALTDLPTAMPDEVFCRDIPCLLEELDLYVSSAACGFRKPNPAGVRSIAESFHSCPRSILLIGDEEKDRRTAENAGCSFRLIHREGEQGEMALWTLLEREKLLL